MANGLQPPHVRRRIAVERDADPRRERRRLQLVEAAIDCISRLGLRETKVQDVAAQADMAVGSINQYFDGKEALFTAVLAHLAEEFQSAWQEALAGAGSAPAPRLLSFVMTYFRPAICTRRKVAVWFAFWGEVRAQPQYRQVCQTYDRRHDEVLAELCQAVINEGGYTGLAPQAAAKAIAALCQGLWLEFLTGTDGLARRELAGLARLQLGAHFPRHRPAFGPPEEQEPMA
jgi:TetR/AcrR family transcriptional repressor of bet genes